MYGRIPEGGIPEVVGGTPSLPKAARMYTRILRCVHRLRVELRLIFHEPLFILHFEPLNG